jgi:hypothetical protein
MMILSHPILTTEMYAWEAFYVPQIGLLRTMVVKERWAVVAKIDEGCPSDLIEIVTKLWYRQRMVCWSHFMNS